MTFQKCGHIVQAGVVRRPPGLKRGQIKNAVREKNKNNPVILSQ